jgi:hypothetical protein
MKRNVASIEEKGQGIEGMLNLAIGEKKEGMEYLTHYMSEE